MIIANPKERSRFVRFAIVGSIGAIIDIGAFNLFISLFHLEALSAQAISFSIAVLSNFTWNRLWTYPDSRSKSLSRQMVQFFVVSLMGLGIRTLIFGKLEEVLSSLASQILPANSLSPNFVGHNLSLATVIVIIMFWNFIVNRYWTYNDVSK
jgi:putative flippase GtrA